MIIYGLCKAKKDSYKKDCKETKKKKKEINGMNYDFTQKELDYINQNARFDERQQEIFNRLVDKKGRQTIVQISLEENISTATVSRIIKQIKKKILRVL